MTIDGITYLNPDAVNGLNLYAYCLNNPVAYCDETGCVPWMAIAVAGIIIGAVVGGICGASLSVATPGNMEIEYPIPETNPNIIVPNKPLEDTNIINTNPGNEENLSSKPETKDLSLGERFANIIIWSSVGAVAGCAVGILFALPLVTSYKIVAFKMVCLATAIWMISSVILGAFGIAMSAPSFKPSEIPYPEIPSTNQEYKHPSIR